MKRSCDKWLCVDFGTNLIAGQVHGYLDFKNNKTYISFSISLGLYINCWNIGIQHSEVSEVYMLGLMHAHGLHAWCT